MIEVYKIPDMGFMVFVEDLKPLIDKACDFIGLVDNDPSRPLKSIACIDVALDHAERLRDELEVERSKIRALKEKLGKGL